AVAATGRRGQSFVGRGVGGKLTKTRGQSQPGGGACARGWPRWAGGLPPRRSPNFTMHHELRSPDDARAFLLQGLHLQRLLPVRADSVRPALEWALEIASAGQ